MADKLQAFSNMTTRQKAMIGVFALIVIVIIWQAMGLMGGDEPTTITPQPRPGATAGGSPPANLAQQGPAAPTPQPMTPQPALLQKQSSAMTQREMELMKLQEETQAKYLAALNELQMLRVSRELAETNQAIMTAKLATVTAQKGILDLLAPPVQPQVAPQAYASGLVNPATTGPGMPPTAQITSPTAAPEVTYAAISVSQLQYRWSAVLGYQGTLYYVSVGDVLPADGSKVIAIDKSGVMLEKNGVKRKISLVAII